MTLGPHLVETNVGIRGTGALVPVRPMAAAPTPILAALTEPVSYRDHCPPIKNQGSTPMCVGFASAAYDEFLTRVLFESCPPLSPEWIYNQAKQRDGVPNAQGTYVETAITVLRDLGDVREVDYPFYEPAVGQKPSDTVRQTTEYKLASWHYVNGSAQVAAALGSLGPVILTIGCSKQMLFARPDGIIDIDPGDGGLIPYHAILAVGADPNTRRVTLQNSWGAEWADHGRCYVSFDWLDRFSYGGFVLVADVSGKLQADLDADSVVTVRDAYQALMMAAGRRQPSDFLRRIGDLDGDGRVTVKDALAILRRVIGG